MYSTFNQRSILSGLNGTGHKCGGVVLAGTLRLRDRSFNNPVDDDYNPMVVQLSVSMSPKAGIGVWTPGDHAEILQYSGAIVAPVCRGGARA